MLCIRTSFGLNVYPWLFYVPYALGIMLLTLQYAYSYFNHFQEMNVRGGSVQLIYNFGKFLNGLWNRHSGLF